MIYDHIDQQLRYRGVHPGIGAAFDYLLKFDPATPDGKYAIEGDRVFAMVQSYTTSPASQRKYEAHKKYIDLQYIVTGEELIYHLPAGLLTVTEPYKEEKDVLKATGADDQALVMRPGDFSILFPHDGHKPNCSHGKDQAVKKVVLKISM